MRVDAQRFVALQSSPQTVARIRCGKALILWQSRIPEGEQNNNEKTRLSNASGSGCCDP
jgi:hypothetical protein